MADWDSDSDDEQPIGARIHGGDKTLCSEQCYRMTVLFMIILVFVGVVLAFVFSLLTWLELQGEINLTSAVIDRLVAMAQAMSLGLAPTA